MNAAHDIPSRFTAAARDYRPEDAPTFATCRYCGTEDEMGVGGTDCPNCGYSGYCATCGDGPLDGEEMYTATACCPACDRDQADEAAADRKE